MRQFLVGCVYLLFFVNNLGFGFPRSSFLHFSWNEICKNSLFREQPQVRPHVMQGLVVALSECQRQFRNRRWNCTEKGKSLEKIMRYDFRESAFALAIKAAGVTYSIARACSLGELEFCGCDHFKYRGGNSVKKLPGLDDQFRSRGLCETNIKYGEGVSKSIFAGEKTATEARSRLVRWNYQAGRTALRKLMQTNCRCFGYSSTCTQKKCWLVLPQSFNRVGARLKERFDSATKVSYGNKGEEFYPADKNTKDPTSEDLLYTMDSPSFCKEDENIGSFGTKGRHCNSTSMGVDGCDLMCCQRGYVSRTVVKQTHCKCNFIWCCTVKCEICPSVKIVNTCM